MLTLAEIPDFEFQIERHSAKSQLGTVGWKHYDICAHNFEAPSDTLQQGLGTYARAIFLNNFYENSTPSIVTVKIIKKKQQSLSNKNLQNNKHNTTEQKTNANNKQKNGITKRKIISVGGIPNSKEVCIHTVDINYHLFFARAVLIFSATRSKHCGKVQKYTFTQQKCTVKVQKYIFNLQKHTFNLQKHIFKVQMYTSKVQRYTFKVQKHVFKVQKYTFKGILSK